MKKRTMKILSLVLAIVMALSILPLAALAEETGEVAAVVYGPDFTKIIAEHEGKPSDIISILTNALGGEDPIPDATITLTDVTNRNNKVTMKKSEDIRFNESLHFDSKTIQEMKDSIPEKELAVENAQSAYDKAKSVRAAMTIWNSTAKQRLDADKKIATALSTLTFAKTTLATAQVAALAAEKGGSFFIDNVNIAEAGRGYIYETYTSGKIKAGRYAMHIEQFEGEGYALTDYSLRDQIIDVSYNDGKRIFVGEERALGGDFDYGSGTLDFKLVFPGFWMKKIDIGFSFTNADIVGSPISGAQFAMINRDEVIKVLEFMKSLGEDNFNTIMANAQNEDVFDYKEVLALHRDLIESNDGVLSLNTDAARKIVTSYIALFTGVDENFWNDFSSARADGMVVPAILETEVGTDGLVTFNEESNVTLTWMMDEMDKIFEYVTADSEGLKVLYNLYIQLKTISQNLLNTAGYFIAQTAGVVGDKMPSGNYIMFQSEAPANYVKNPIFYTMNVTWNNPTWLYVTVAELGIIGPYFAAEFYDYVRGTEFEGPVAKLLGLTAKGNEFGEDVTAYQMYVWNNLQALLEEKRSDLGNKETRTLMGALTAFIANSTYQPLGLNLLFASKTGLMQGMNQYFIDNGASATALSQYLVAQTTRAKEVFAGTVDENWVFYNLDKSPTQTATKLITKSTNDIADILDESTSSTVRGDAVRERGEMTKDVVSTVGNKVESTTQKIQASIQKKVGDTLTTLKNKVVDSIKSFAVNLVNKLFSRNS